MLRHRVIPVLLYSGDGLVKTQKFENPVYIGDPLNTVRIFNQKKVDEILLLDISRSKMNEGPNFELVRKITSECFMPLSYGGGIRTLSDAKELFALGVEKIVVQTAGIKNQQLITAIANFTGSQSISISIDVLQIGPNNFRVYHAATKRTLETPLLQVINQVQDAGAGELIITSVLHEGGMKGYNLDLIKFVRGTARIPIVAHGGAGSIKDFAEVISVGADAVAAGSFFVFYGPRKGVLITYPKYEDLELAIGVGND